MSKLNIKLPNLKAFFDKKNQIFISTKNEIIKILLKKNNINKVYYKNNEDLKFNLLKNKPSQANQVGKGVWHNFKKVDSAWKVNNKSFSQIPMGYHPVVGLPNVKVSYIWAYLAKYKRWEKI